MADAHNAQLRGLNSIIQQAPHVPEFSSPDFCAQDVRDLLFYVATWVKAMEHHHHMEETVVFPGVDALAGQPGFMDGPRDQHAEFNGGLHELLEYAQGTNAEAYCWEGEGGMKRVIDGFAPSLTSHLYGEIDVMLGLQSRLDSVALRKCWDEGIEVVKKGSGLAILVCY